MAVVMVTVTMVMVVVIRMDFQGGAPPLFFLAREVLIS
jgi:hypothetical protein